MNHPSWADFTRVVIVGAGAVGSILGARLHDHIPTTLVARPDHVDAIRRQGLHIGGLEDTTVQLDVRTDLPADLAATLVILTLKTTALADIAAALAPRLTPTTTLVVACNGYRPEERLARVLGPDVPVHRLLVALGAHFVAPGQVDFWGGGAIELPQTDLGHRLERLCRTAGLETELVHDFNFAIWRKLTVNCVVNPLTALLRVRNMMVVTPELDDIRREIVEECQAVAAHERVYFPADFVSTLDTVIQGHHNVSSMLQDLLRGRPTEIEDINGAVVAAGAAYGVPTPINGLLTHLIRAYETTVPKMEVRT